MPLQKLHTKMHVSYWIYFFFNDKVLCAQSAMQWNTDWLIGYMSIDKSKFLFVTDACELLQIVSFCQKRFF